LNRYFYSLNALGLVEVARMKKPPFQFGLKAGFLAMAVREE
jgi:hypothetical protein